MLLKRITDSKHTDVKALVELHNQEFSEYERFRGTRLLYNLIDGAHDMFFHLVHENEKLAGFFIYWDLKTSYYIHFIAIFPEMRNHRIGQKVFDWVVKNLQKPIFLEVDIPFNEITQRRLNFYKRNGFTEIANDPHTLSSVRLGEHPLWLMGNKVVDNLESYLIKIRDVVYYGTGE